MVCFLTSWVATAPMRGTLASIVGLALILVACISQTASLEERAQAIDRTLMCPVCPSETIDQSQVPLALQMRQRVRHMLAQGASRDEINDHFTARYGQEVLAAPPKSGASLTAWVVPLAGFLVGAAALGLALRAMRRNPAREQAGDEASEAELASYLERVDSELGVDIGDPDRKDCSPSRYYASQ